MENKLVHVYEHDDMKQLDYEKKLDNQLFHIMDKNTVLYKEEKKMDTTINQYTTKSFNRKQYNYVYNYHYY